MMVIYSRAELALKLQPLWAEKAKANISASGGDRRSVSVSVYQKSDEPIEQQPAVTAAPITAERPSTPSNYFRAELALNLRLSAQPIFTTGCSPHWMM
jgi:hypothetical protein